MRGLFLATVGTAILMAAPAHATFQIAIDVNGNIVTCADGASCDANTATGTLELEDFLLDGVVFSGSFSISGRGPDLLTTAGSDIINTTNSARNIQIVVSDTGFTGPVTSVTTSGSGTWVKAGSNLTLTWYADMANGQGAGGGLAHPGTQVDMDTSTAVGPTDSFSIPDTVVPFITSNPFSMTEVANINLVAKGELTSFGQAEVATSVPETSTWAMMGLGFASFALLGFYRKRQPISILG